MSKSRKTQKECVPFSEKHPKIVKGFSALVSLVFIAILLFGVFWILKQIGSSIYDFIKWGKDKLSKLDSVVVVALITGAVSIIGVLFTSVVSKIIEYKQKRRDYLNQKREIAYGEFVDMYFKIHENANGIKNYTKKEMIDDMFKFSRELTLWGSNRVVKKWIKFRLNGIENTENTMELIEDILYDMRKDFGYKRMNQGILLKMVVNDYDEHKKNKRKGEK